MVRPRPDLHYPQGARRCPLPNSQHRHLTQTTLLGVPLREADSEAYGHVFPTKPSPNSSIVTFQNIGPQPQLGSTSRAQFNSRSFSKCNSSISLYAEPCLNERALFPADLFSARITRASPSAYTYLSNNTTEDSAWNQTGGTGFSIHHSLLSHKTSHGADPTGLGRWTYIRLQGKHGSSISFFSAYRPCRNPTTLGSVWNQHLRFFQLQGIASPDPCSIFDTDLFAAITTSLDAGDNVVIGIDNNADVRSSWLATKFVSLGLSDAILSQHSPASPPCYPQQEHRQNSY